MKRRAFIKALVGAAAAVMIPLQLTVFGSELDLVLSASTPLNITWKSWESVGIGFINMDAVRKLKLYK